ncbi:hypothetical protein L1987_34359 [Smallanthus sonchifolius]|uniref:Uncharacterized protein n=1 Tax=Smallanthus sonchifolius TaxID=185202 RepID=A0ACB9HTM3_9ASTR|nr:hypothetical protein L1987_34359 [Smallanthus sonchifolius]
MAELAFDMVEQILVRLDVEDLIRCKSVCNSWQSFISCPRFKDRYGDNLLHVVGSCNGLVCVSPKDAELVVTNPSTREHKKLQTPPYQSKVKRVRDAVCWGFGYDSSAADYNLMEKAD